MIEHIISQMETERGLDRSAAIADMSFRFIRELCEATVIKPHESKEHEGATVATRYSQANTRRYRLSLYHGLIFCLTFNVIGAWLQGLLESGIEG